MWRMELPEENMKLRPNSLLKNLKNIKAYVENKGQCGNKQGHRDGKIMIAELQVLYPTISKDLFLNCVYVRFSLCMGISLMCICRFP